MWTVGWRFAPVSEIERALKTEQVSSFDLVSELIGAIQHEDGATRAMCCMDFNAALDAAAAADRLRASGVGGPLLGVPITIKESFNIANMPTTWGIPRERPHVPAEDAVVVSRLKSAGAVILGKTNVSADLADWQCSNRVYGTTSNPYDLGRTPGGSSGGSAAALALGYGPLSIGSDVAGSLRVPAHYCGVCAHKPTFRVVSVRGHVRPPEAVLDNSMSDLVVVGPMARNVRDLRKLLLVIMGPDPSGDGMAFTLRLPHPRKRRLGEFRLLIVYDHPLTPTAHCIRDSLQALGATLARRCAKVAYRSTVLPDLARCARVFARLLMAKVGPLLDDSSYGHLQAGAAALSNEDESLSAEQLRGMTLSHRDWLKADAERNALRRQWTAFFSEFDALLCPVAPTLALRQRSTAQLWRQTIDVDGKRVPYFDQLAWSSIASVGGLPATIIPVGHLVNGLPMGIQIVGPQFGDLTTLKLGELIERECGGFIAPNTISQSHIG